MGRHVLACEGHSWCSGGHVAGWVLLALAVGVVLIAVAWRLLVRYYYTERDRPARRPRRRP